MALFKKAAIALAVAGALSTASVAQAASIDGITFGGGAFSFVTSTIMEQRVGGGLITNVGDVLEGVGQVTQIYSGSTLVWSNGDNGRELTLAFGGYTASLVSPGTFEFTGGFTRLYSDSTPDASFGAGTGFTDGNLWMDLVAVPFTNLGTGNNVTLVSSGVLLGNSISGTGIGLLEVTGAGLADAVFNTNTHTAFGTNLSADWELSSAFNNTFSPFLYDTHGTASISGNAIPEPASLALLGIGVLAAAGISRRRRAK